ncbi:hypothetical protein HK104_001192, partial [Borealophlyctis nickersoniae]
IKYAGLDRVQDPFYRWFMSSEWATHFQGRKRGKFLKSQVWSRWSQRKEVMVVDTPAALQDPDTGSPNPCGYPSLPWLQQTPTAPVNRREAKELNCQELLKMPELVTFGEGHASARRDTLTAVAELAKTQLHISDACPQHVCLTLADHIMARLEALPLLDLARDSNNATTLLEVVLSRYVMGPSAAPDEGDGAGIGGPGRNLGEWKGGLDARIRNLSSKVAEFRDVLEGSGSHPKEQQAQSAPASPVSAGPSQVPFPVRTPPSPPQTPSFPMFPTSWKHTPDPTIDGPLRDMISTIIATYSELVTSHNTTDEERIFISSQCITHLSREIDSLFCSVPPSTIDGNAKGWPKYRACLEMSRPDRKELVSRCLTELQARVLDAVQDAEFRHRRKELNRQVEEILGRLEGFRSFVNCVDGLVEKLDVHDPYGVGMRAAEVVFMQVEATERT